MLVVEADASKAIFAVKNELAILKVARLNAAKAKVAVVEDVITAAVVAKLTVFEHGNVVTVLNFFALDDVTDVLALNDVKRCEHVF